MCAVGGRVRASNILGRIVAALGKESPSTPTPRLCTTWSSVAAMWHSMRAVRAVRGLTRDGAQVFVSPIHLYAIVSSRRTPRSEQNQCSKTQFQRPSARKVSVRNLPAPVRNAESAHGSTFPLRCAGDFFSFRGLTSHRADRHCTQVPDFQKLHAQEEKRLQALRVQNRRHLTIPNEFSFSAVKHHKHGNDACPRMCCCAWYWSTGESLAVTYATALYTKFSFAALICASDGSVRPVTTATPARHGSAAVAAHSHAQTPFAVKVWACL